MKVSDVLTTMSLAAIKAKLIGYLKDAKAAPTDWNSGAFLRSLMVQWSTALVDYVGPASPDPTLREVLFAGGFPILPDTPTAVASAWLTLVAEQLFNVVRNFSLAGVQFAGTFTVQTVTLTCDVSHGPYSITPGSHVIGAVVGVGANGRSIIGNRYVSFGTATVPNNGSVTCAFRAEFGNDSINGFNYSDGAGTLADLSANPMPGVTASNVAPSFSAVTTSPSPAVGLGLVTVSGSPPAAATAYDVRIVADGQVGTATFQYRANGGAWSGTIVTAATYTIPSGPTLNFANDGGGANPSFIHDDRYTFTSPGSPIATQGLDPETDVDLLERCLSRWVALDDVLPEKHEAWAKEASALVKRVRVSGSSSKPGFYNVTIAGTVNPLAGGVVTAVQLYIDQREGITAQSTVAAATTVAIVASGPVYVPAAKLARAQAAAAALWVPYVNGTDIGGVVRLSKLEQFLRSAGVVDVGALDLNSGTEVDLTATQVALAGDITTSLTWKAI